MTVYTIRLQAVDERATLASLRIVLKLLLRRYGFKCIGIVEEAP